MNIILYYFYYIVLLYNVIRLLYIITAYCTYR